MNNTQIRADILYRRAQLRALAQPSSVRANPDLETAAAEFAAGQGATQASPAEQAGLERRRTAALSERDRQFDARISERERQLDAGLDELDRYMDTWEKQNKWATALGVMNLATQGVSAWSQDQALERQEAMRLKQQETMDQMVKQTQLANLAQQKRFDQALTTQNEEQGRVADDVRLQLAMTRQDPTDRLFINELARKRYGETPELITRF